MSMTIIRLNANVDVTKLKEDTMNRLFNMLPANGRAIGVFMVWFGLGFPQSTEIGSFKVLLDAGMMWIVTAVYILCGLAILSGRPRGIWYHACVVPWMLYIPVTLGLAILQNAYVAISPLALYAAVWFYTTRDAYDGGKHAG